MIFPNRLTKTELKQGLGYMAVSLLILPGILGLLPLRAGQLNFVYYCINFAAVVFILRRFLLQNLRIALDHPFPTLYFGALSYLGYEAFGRIIAIAILSAFPGFANVNDRSILTMMAEDPILMTVGVVLLAPVAEECFHRGLIFRGLYDRSPALAYLVSMIAFAALHVVGYVGQFEPLQLLLCFVQYLPAGYCLCFAYRRSGTIISPIIVHCVINALSVYNAVR